MANARPLNRTNNDAWAFITRKDDGLTFVTAVLNISEGIVSTILRCDRQNPRNMAEARALAIAYLYAGMSVSTNVFIMLGRVLPTPPPHRCSTMLPWSEGRGAILNYAHACDQEQGLIVNGIHQDGSIFHPEDHAADRELALRLNISMVGLVPPSPDVGELQQEIQRLNQKLCSEHGRLVMAQNDLTTVQNNVTCEQQRVAQTRGGSSRPTSHGPGVLNVALHETSTGT